MQPSALPSSTGSLAMYLAEINKYPLLTVDEEQRLARLYAKSGDLDAAHKLVTSNLRFVVKVAYEVVFDEEHRAVEVSGCSRGRSHGIRRLADQQRLIAGNEIDGGKTAIQSGRQLIGVQAQLRRLIP